MKVKIMYHITSRQEQRRKQKNEITDLLVFNASHQLVSEKDIDNRLRM
ncbi:hypothetical protein [Propionispira raffinosivorans]|nr:hypothetical protein [Propionispira raffinosivorans]